MPWSQCADMSGGGGCSAMLVIAVVLCGNNSDSCSGGLAAGALSARLRAAVLAYLGVVFPASLSGARVGERDLCSRRPVSVGVGAAAA